MQISVPLYHAQATGFPVVDLLHIAATEEAGKAEVAAIGALATQQAEIEAAKAKLLAAIEVAKAAEIAALEAKSFLERYVIYPAIRVLIMTLIQTMTEDILGWIKGDGGRGVGFVKNLEQNAFTEANLQAGEFLNHVSGIDLCSADISKMIRLTINVPGYQHLGAQLGCTLTGIIDNVDRFYQDFNNGGWPAFVGIAVDSQNNAIGASMIAEVNFAARKGSAAKALQDRLNRGSGFEGVTLTKKSTVCEAPSESGGAEFLGFDPVPFCYTQEVDTTPGGVVADALNTQLNHVGLDMGIAELGAVSQEIDGAISAIITALMQRVF
ncbi:MAG: hypothetical protein AAB975_02405, partial [Patescibacteria group bacterium]